MDVHEDKRKGKEEIWERTKKSKQLEENIKLKKKKGQNREQ